MRRFGFGPRRPFANTDIPPALQRANELMTVGNFSEAVIAFEQLARGAEARKGPRAPFLFLQAGRARILLNQNVAGVNLFRHGLELFAASGRHNQLYRSGARIVRELSARGLQKEAQEISALMQSNIPAISESPTQPDFEPARVNLPTHCPSCGGPIRSDEVDWIDPATAECPFCGSPVRATK